MTREIKLLIMLMSAFMLCLSFSLVLNRITSDDCPVAKVQLQIIATARPKMGPLEREFLQKAIMVAALKHKVPADILTAKVNRESNFNRLAVGSKGEKGISQLMPMWTRGIDPFETEPNLDKGAEILAAELKETKGDMYRALRRYNGGGPNGENIEKTKGYADAIQADVHRAERKVCRG